MSRSPGDLWPVLRRWGLLFIQRYEMETYTYLMEPWEKVLTNTVFLIWIYLMVASLRALLDVILTVSSSVSSQCEWM